MKNCLEVSILFYFFLITNCFSQTDSDKNNVPRQDTGISGIVYVGGAELHYIVEGKGIPCIVLGHSLSQYRILSQALRDHFRFIFADLRHDAQSNSSLELSELSLNTYLNDINAILDTLDLEKSAIFAHSHHSFIDTALGEEDKFWKSDASKERKMIFKRNWKRLRKEGLTKMPPKERYIKTYSAMTPKLMYDPKGDLSYIVNVIDNNTEVFLHLQLTILGDYDIIKGPEISIIVFLALGRYDYVCPYKLWEERKGVFLNLSYNLFEKSGHFPMVEEQDLFDEKLIDWIVIH